MAEKKNCWQVQRCGREPWGENTKELGVCQAAKCNELDRVHGGINGGRACWAVVGTHCGGKVRGTFAEKMKQCENCTFYERVRSEEGTDFQLTPVLLKKLQKVSKK